jgi:SAM-dependent methyltransferase
LSLGELAEEQFHFINTEQVFEHLTDPLLVRQALARALIPGGILKISVPLAADACSIAAQLRDDNASVDGERLMPVAPLEHINGFNYHAVGVFASRLGLTVVRPSLAKRYAFLTERGAFDFRDPKSVAKELARPLWQDRNRRNLYAWLQKRVAEAGESCGGQPQ